MQKAFFDWREIRMEFQQMVSISVRLELEVELGFRPLSCKMPKKTGKYFFRGIFAFRGILESFILAGK